MSETARHISREQFVDSNTLLRRLIGNTALSTSYGGLLVSSVNGWQAEIFEIEAGRQTTSAEVFRCNWVDLHTSTGKQPLWSGMAHVGVPLSNYGPAMLQVHSEDFSRRGFPCEMIVMTTERLAE